MKLSKVNYEKLKEKTEKYLTCLNCGNKEDMEIDDSEYHLTSRTKYKSQISYVNNPDSFTSLASITCPKCGCVKLFNLKTLGIS